MSPLPDMTRRAAAHVRRPRATAARPPAPPSGVVPHRRLLAAAGAAAAWLTLASASGPVTSARAAPPEVEPEPPGPRATAAPTPPMPALPPAADASGGKAQAPRATPRTAPPSARADVRFVRSTAEAASSPRPVETAHAAYARGDLTGARQHYLRAIAADPHDADALGGLGAIALREQRSAEAAVLFRRALRARPDDPVAVAGLARLDAADPQQAESRLRLSLASRPDAAETLAIRIALADTLARQQRWAEAQQAWFQAYSLAPEDADIAYNLAVSLDHLGQRRLAADFYRRALRQARLQPTARFPRELCEARLDALAPHP